LSIYLGKNEGATGPVSDFSGVGPLAHNHN
jgi:hypothetical protein